MKRQIPGFDGYSVDALGTVWSEKPGRHGRYTEPHILKSHAGHDGYLHVSLRAGGKRARRHAVHQLVALAFLGPRPDGFEVCHCNGNSRDNRASNLRYASHAENIGDRESHGRTCRGDRSHLAKLTDEQCVEMLQRFRRGIPRQKIADDFGVSLSHVYALSQGRIRKHLFSTTWGVRG